MDSSRRVEEVARGVNFGVLEEKIYVASEREKGSVGANRARSR